MKRLKDKVMMLTLAWHCNANCSSTFPSESEDIGKFFEVKSACPPRDEFFLKRMSMILERQKIVPCPRQLFLFDDLMLRPLTLLFYERRMIRSVQEKEAPRYQ